MLSFLHLLDKLLGGDPSCLLLAVRREESLRIEKIYMHHNPIVFQWLDAFKRFANPAVQRTSGTRPFVFFCVLARGIEWQRLVFLLFKWFRRTNGYSARFVLVVAARQNLFSSLG